MPGWAIRLQNDKGGTREDAAFFMLERAMGIEPTLAAWEAAVLPLNYARGTRPVYAAGPRRATPDAPALQSLTQNLPPTFRKKLASWPPFWPTVRLLPVVISKPPSWLRTP